MNLSLDTATVAEGFKAASDETRLKMLALLLKHGELCVCDLMHVLNITQSKASRHLRYLRNNGFVQDRRDGVWMHYRIAEPLPHDRAAILEAVKTSIPPKTMTELGVHLRKWKHSKNCDVGNNMRRATRNGGSRRS